MEIILEFHKSEWGLIEKSPTVEISTTLEEIEKFMIATDCIK